MFSLFRKPASDGLIATAATAVWACCDEIEQQDDALAIAALATVYVQTRAPEFRVPQSVQDRFLETVWMVVVSDRPSLHVGFMKFVAAAAVAMHASSPKFGPHDFVDDFWADYLCKYSKGFIRSEYEEFANTILAVIDRSIETDSTRWRHGV
jgi:hypothetical protein